MGDFSSYYKYEKFEVIGDELIPLGIYSIDADGTMPYVVKEECDTACGCIEPQYRWIQTEDTICIEVLTQTVSGSPYCVGYDRYEDVYSQVSYDNGVTWETTATTSTMIEENSSACGYVPPTPTTEYRWVDDGGTTCVGVDKYNRKVKQVSYDGGSTWMNVSPLTVSATTLVEANSPDCGYIAPQYRTISGDPYCNGVDKYEDVYSQVSYDGGSSWETTATTSTLIQAKSADCGYAERTISGDPYCSGVDKYVDVSAQTSSDSGSTWTTTATTPTLVQAKSTDCGFSARTISTATTCVGVDKHYLDEYQESSDSGATWTTISSSTGTLIEAKSADCGYAERTISGTPYCDGADLVVVTSAQTSSDSGSTWTTVSTAITMVEAGGCATPASPKFTLTLSDSSTVTAECDTSTTLTYAEIQTQYSYNLVSAVIGDCVIAIDDAAFASIYTLTSVTLSNSVTTIGRAAFGNSPYITNIVMGNSVTTIGKQAFDGCRSLTAVTIPNTVTSIGEEAFDYCKSLTSIVIPSSVTMIENETFYGCSSLTSVTIGSVTSIGSSAFSECENLEVIRINNPTPPVLGTDVFEYCLNLNTIYVPSESVNAYKSANGWSAFSSIIQAIP